VSKNLFNANELQKVEFLIKNNQLFEENRTFFNPNFLLADELALYILE
jgi:oxygen-independent coproporphyrinogen-3 oxidase